MSVCVRVCVSVYMCVCVCVCWWIQKLLSLKKIFKSETRVPLNKIKKKRFCGPSLL